MTVLFSKINLPSTKVLVSTAASVAATAMIAKEYLPSELRKYLRTQLYSFLSTFSNEITLVIEEFDGLKKNRLFHAAELYVGSISSPNIKRYLAVLPEKENKIHVSLGGSDEVDDKFRGIHLQWRLVTKKSARRNIRDPDDYGSAMITSDKKSLNLTFHKKHKHRVIEEYLPYVVERWEDLKQEQKTLKLHTLKTERGHGSMANPWQSVNLDHPAKFETLAMEDELKKMIVDDLDRFLNRRELYRMVGKAWKRGYLLFGPPGTGKSSLIAAISNYLNFDVYDLELTDIRSNSELRRLVIATENRSILVVEDIDASIDLTERKKESRTNMQPYGHPEHKVTLSGLLNFIDGLWSSCGDERIIIFTTNHKEKLDPALLRPGRMDVHIHMSYCTPCGFKLLATNYLGVAEHPLALKAEELIATTKVTPAEVGEQLLKSDDRELALEGLINFLELKKEEAELEYGMKSKSKRCDGLKELLKIAEELPPEKCEEMLKKDEGANAVRFLIGFLQQGTGSGNGNGAGRSDSGK